TASAALSPPERRGVARGGAQLLGDDEEAVVLRGALGAGGGARLDLAGAGRDGEVGDERVLGLAGAMRDDVAVAGLGRARHRGARLGQRSDLVHLDEDRIGETVGNALREQLLVGAEEIVTHQLYPAAERRGEGFPAGAVVLAQAVLDRDDRVARAPALVERDQVRGRPAWAAGLAEDVPVAVGELAGRAVERQGDVATR